MDPYLEANAAFSKFSRNYMEQKKDLPIRPSEMGVLNIITGTPGPHTPVRLAQLLGVSKPMITAYLTSLAEKGYITKQPSSEDKRAYHILPTEQARQLVERARVDMVRQLETLMNALGQEDFDKFVDLAWRANDILEANRGENDKEIKRAE